MAEEEKDTRKDQRFPAWHQRNKPDEPKVEKPE